MGEIVLDEVSVMSYQAQEREKWNRICKCVKGLKQDLSQLCTEMPDNEYKEKLSYIMEHYFV